MECGEKRDNTDKRADGARCTSSHKTTAVHISSALNRDTVINVTQHYLLSFVNISCVTLLLAVLRK